ncbi:ANKRD50 [Symbiodinium sp. KB8]|nr:ANKRD50 [Symbiodinium sp. KB8]
MLRVRHLSGRELVTATEEEVAALADAHGSVIKGIEQLVSLPVGQPCFRLKLLCGDTVLSQDTNLKLPLELQVTICDFVEVDAGDVDRLSNASQENDAASVEALLRRPQNPDLVDSRGRTALMAAAESGALESVQLLTSACVDLDKTREGSCDTAVSAAALNGHLDVVRFLVEKGADKDKAATDGVTPVLVAAYSGHVHVVRFLIEMGADKDKANSNGATPVFIASQNGHIDVLRLLIETGADMDKAKTAGATPVYIACERGHTDVVCLLVEKRADKDAARNDGATPLFVASAHAHLDVVRVLLENGANKDKAMHNGATPLYIASQNGHLDVVRLLIETGADKDRARNDGATPIYIASEKGHSDVVRLLIEKGAVATRSAWGHLRVMCFLYACDGVVRLLIDRGADKNLASNDGGTPLLVASQNGHADVVRLPSEKGATDAARNCGPTALYIACQSGDLEVVRLLSEKFANMDAGRWGLWFFSCMKRSLRFRALVAKTAGASSKPVAQSPGNLFSLGIIRFPTDELFVANVRILEDSNATRGVDFEFYPDAVTWQSGDVNSQAILLFIFDDDLAEKMKYLHLGFDVLVPATANNESKMEIFIRDDNDGGNLVITPHFARVTERYGTGECVFYGDRQGGTSGAAGAFVTKAGFISFIPETASRC